AAASARFELGAEPVWVAPGTEAAQWLVATHHWLHVLDVRAGGAKVLRSRFLPADFEPAARAGEQTIRGFGGPGGADIVTLELDAEPPPLDAQAPVLTRDWSDVLGLRLAGNGSIEAIIR